MFVSVLIFYIFTYIMSDFMVELFNIFIYNFGKMAPLLLFVNSLYLLWNKNNLFYYYVCGVFLNAILNLVLKGIIKEPRPSEDPKLFNIALKHSIRFKFVKLLLKSIKF